MEPWSAAAAVIVLAALAVDRTRLYRWLPVLVNRLRRGGPPR